MSELGRVTKVDLRTIWADEAKDFTPWLAGEGLDLLASALGMDLELVEEEHAIDWCLLTRHLDKRNRHRCYSGH